MRKSKPKFSGELIEPIYVKKRTPKGSIRPIPEDLLPTIFDRTNERLLLLLDHYGIRRAAEKRWWLLSAYLARDFVPGFQMVEPPGAPQQWGPTELQALYARVNELMASGMKVTTACKKIADARNQDQGFPWRCSADTYRRRYYQAKKAAE